MDDRKEDARKALGWTKSNGTKNAKHRKEEPMEKLTDPGHDKGG